MNGILWILSSLLSVVTYTNGRVTIVNTYRPMYVSYGSNLTLTCESDNRRILEWVQDIPDTGWNKEKIIPQIGGNIETRYTVVEPSGAVINTLTKSNIRLEDRGMYQCQDDIQDNSFALWVTVLYIQRVDTRAIPNEEADLFCTLLGFETNIPHIDYFWYYKEMEIVTENNRYDLVHRDGVSQLTINKPTREDDGEYTCAFTLQTSREPITVSSTVYLNAMALPSSGSSHITITMVTILLMVTIERILVLI